MDRDQRTVFCGNLSNRVTEDILYELFLQAGPVEEVKIPKVRESRPRAYGFVTFKHDESVDYALELFKGTSLYSRELTVDKKTRAVPEPPPIIQHPQMLLQQTLCNSLMGGMIPQFPYGIPIGYPVPYVSQDQMNYRGPVNMYPSMNDRRNNSRRHHYHN